MFGPFSSTKELLDKLIELQKGMRDSIIMKRNLLVNQLQNFAMRDDKNVSQVYGRFKEVLNELHVIGEKIENWDLVRYLKVFPRVTLWSSLVDAYKVYRDFSLVKLCELFCIFELHKQANLVLK